MNTSVMDNAALAGVLNRVLSQKANLINASRIAAARGLGLEETRRHRTQLNDSLMLVLESEGGTTTVEGTVYGGVSVRLIGVDGIYMETPLKGHMVFLKNKDVPGVIGRVGTILGENNINIADFSLGRRENSMAPGEPAEAVAVVRIDGPLPKAVLDQLLELTPVRFGRAVQLPE